MKPIAATEVVKKRGSRESAVVIGRFVIPHKAHLELFEQAYSYRPVDLLTVAVVMGNPSTQNTSRNPTTFEQRKKMIEEIFHFPHEIVTIWAGWVGELINILRRRDIEPIVLLAGPDRVEEYRRQVRVYGKEMNTDIVVVERERLVLESVRGVDLREAIVSGNKKLFEGMVPVELYTYWEELRRTVKT